MIFEISKEFFIINNNHKLNKSIEESIFRMDFEISSFLFICRNLDVPFSLVGAE